MTRPWLETVIPIGIMLLSTLSCGPFMNVKKPTKVVDLAPMVGKSLQEMTALLGPPKQMGICHGWDFADGELSACYRDATNKMYTLHYRLPPAPLFTPTTAVSTPEEMAALVRVDLQGRKPDVTIRGGYAYDNYVLGGKAVDLFFDGGPKRIVGVRVDLK
ncbi:MAG: hypothetical protein ABI539_03005 [Acidobacteriota bacterium]